MTNIQSKLLPVTNTCKEFVHPWTDSCWNSTAGLLIQATSHSLRIYTAVYLLSLLLHGRIPTFRDIKRTILGIIQSSAFLSTNGFTFVLFTCLLRNILGKFYLPTVAFVPSFFASLAAIFIERPSRRPLLALYVSNVATESIWRIAETHGYVKSIPNGQVLVFGASISILLYFYRLGFRKIYKDSLYDILRFVVGRNEEYATQREQLLERNDNVENIVQNFNDNQLNLDVQQQERVQRNNSPEIQGENDVTNRISEQNNFIYIMNAIRAYTRLLKYIGAQKRHSSCPHKNGCIYYSIKGGTKLFLVGFGLQITLKLVLQLRKIIQLKLKLRKTIFNKDTLKLGIFLGGFSFLYNSTSCALRHFSDFDDPIFAIPAGLIASIAFTQYPDTTVALYIMWKMLQITYNIGIKKEIVPEVPGFTIILYCLSTATLFHTGLLEPLNLRPSYWKFLHSLSGGRVGIMDRKPFDVWGLSSSNQVEEVIRKTNTNVKNIKFAFS